MGPDGYRLNVATLQVTRHFADLIANLDVEPEPEFVARLMLPFEYTRVSGAPGKSGWTSDPPLREPKSLWWLTAIAAGALGSVVHMLDKTINRRVLRHFHVREPASLTLRLDDLFYPDFGLTAFRGDDRLAKQKQKPQSVAIELQHLRAHAGNGPAEKQPLFSLILYGPPGTGKTTLVEAAAASAGVPLVEITPSDILVGGTEGIERRARQVFQALSKLTHVVILFDEFEQILLDRKMQGGKMPTSVIEFLTPGMLPKLKALYDASKTGRVSYVLATNYLDTIDSAVRRNGRFDRRCAILSARCHLATWPATRSSQRLPKQTEGGIPRETTGIATSVSRPRKEGGRGGRTQGLARQDRSKRRYRNRRRGPPAHHESR